MSQQDYQTAPVSEQSWTTLPNGLVVAQLHDYETDYLFKEIFVDQVYARHSISLPEKACVIDIGANIGLFSLFVKSQCPQAKIYAFEPMQTTFQVLQANFVLHDLGTPLQFAVSNKNAEQVFTYYKNSTVFSGKYADQVADGPKIKAIAENIIHQEFQDLQTEELEAFATLLTQERMDAVEEKVRTITLSNVIAEHHMTNIDLLKIDAEGCELEILSGISEADWPKIQQIVIEVHPRKTLSVEEVAAQITQKGFEIQIEYEALLTQTNFANIYARRPHLV